jgi:hypothetical protein
VGTGDVAELLRLAQPDEGLKVLDVLSVGAARVGIGQVGKPFKLEGDRR